MSDWDSWGVTPSTPAQQNPAATAGGWDDVPTGASASEASLSVHPVHATAPLHGQPSFNNYGSRSSTASQPQVNSSASSTAASDGRQAQTAARFGPPPSQVSEAPKTVNGWTVTTSSSQASVPSPVSQPPTGAPSMSTGASSPIDQGQGFHSPSSFSLSPTTSADNNSQGWKTSNNYGGFTASGGDGGPSFGQDRKGPPVYTFSVPAECRGYVIGAQGANLVRISEETGVRVTRGKPKEGGDPQERDFLFFNDNNVGTDMVEQALVNVVNIVRRKIPDWLPKEGKAAEDAQRLFREGRFGNSNYNRGSTSNDTTNRYNGPNGYREEDAAITSPSFSTNGIAHSAQGTASPGNDDLPTAAGPFKDPQSPRSDNWGGMPPPTFSPGPKSAVSRHSENRETQKSSSITMSGSTGAWKPSAPSFGPRTQAGHPGNAVEPTMTLKTFLRGAQGSKWAAENITPPSFGPAAPTSPQQQNSEAAVPIGPTSAISPPNTASAPQVINGWVVTSPSTQAEAAIMTAVPQEGHQQATVAGNIRSNDHGWDTSSSSAPQSNAFGPVATNPASLGWKVNHLSTNAVPASSVQDIHREETPKPLPAHQSPPVSHERMLTHDSGWDESATRSTNDASRSPPSVATSQPVTVVNGWTVIKPASGSITSHPEPAASLVNSMSNMGLVERHVQPVTNAASPNDSTSINGWTLPTSPAGNIPPRPPQPSTTSLGRSEFTNANTNDGWNASAASRSLAEASSSPVTQFAQPSSTGAPTGGIGWDDDEPMASISPAARPDQGGIGWGDPVPAPASSSSSNGTQAQQRNNGESYGSALDDARSVQPSDSISNVDGSDRSTSTVNGKGNGRGVQYHTDTNGYGSSNADYHGHRERSQGSYNDHLSTHQNSYNQPNGSYSYGPPVERRFPGAGGSWASGPNEIPLRQNRWQTQGGRRPGDDVRRPAVPQAIPGSGW